MGRCRVMIDIPHDRATLVAFLESHGVQFRGNACKCPFHDDQRASAGVYEKDGVWRFKCQPCGAGGDVEDVRKLFEGNTRKPANNGHANGSAKRIVATYKYTDAAGSLLYEALRYEPKDFRQRRPDGHGGWIWKLEGVPRVLYRLADLAAVSDDSIIWIVEGEKDVENLRTAGCIATCNAGGAGKWGTLSDDSILNSHHVCIVADKDKPGRAHAQDVATRLHGRAASIKVIEVPGAACKDASDFLSAGGDAEQLLTLYDAAPDWEPPANPEPGHAEPEASGDNAEPEPLPEPVSWAALHDEHPDRGPVVIEGIMREGFVCSITSGSKCQKSWNMGALLVAAVTGGNWMGHAVTQGRAMLLDGELTRGTIDFRLARIGEAMGIKPHPDLHIHNLRGETHWAWRLLEHAAENQGKYRLIVVDPLYMFYPPKFEENDNGAMKTLIERMIGIATRAKAGIMIVHHQSKGDQSGKRVTDVGGSGGTVALCGRSSCGPRMPMMA